MAKTATETKTKSATKSANTRSRPAKTSAVGGEDKPKREPSAYQVYCKEHMKKWNEENPGRAKEAMAQIAAMWRDAPENPNRGKDLKARKAKEAKKPAAPKAKAEAKPRASRAKKAKEDDDEEDASASDGSD